MDFLLNNLWWGGGSDGPRGREARWRIRKHRKKNPLDEKNPKIGVPVLIPEQSEFPQKAIPKVIEQNVETVVDWLNWLESVKEEEKSWKKEIDPAVEKLKKKIDELWEKRLIVEEGKSAGFSPRVFAESKRAFGQTLARKSTNQSEMRFELQNVSDDWRRRSD